MIANRLPRPGGTAAVLASAVIAVLGLLPAMLALPRVAVIACFEAGHPLYTLTPQTAAVDCVSAPGPVIGWVLMIAGTVLVHLLVMPVLLAVSGLLAQLLLRVIAAVRRTLLLALAAPTTPAFAVVRLDAGRPDARVVADAPHRAQPRRGPPSLD